VVVDAEYGAPVKFSCNLSCISENFIRWYLYEDSIRDSGRTLLHNGLNINMNWSSKGITVDNNQRSPPSVLKINEVTPELTGIYECSGQSDPDARCKMRFCLTAGKYLSQSKFYSYCFLRIRSFLQNFRNLQARNRLQSDEKGSLLGRRLVPFPLSIDIVLFVLVAEAHAALLGVSFD